MFQTTWQLAMLKKCFGGKSRRLSAFQQAYEKEEKFERKFIKKYFAKRKKK